jgi:hypothetical protein
VTQQDGIGRFLDAEGRVRAWPSKQRDRTTVLEYLVELFEPGRRYTEPEVNALLVSRHTWSDPAYLRRMLYTTRLVDRTPDGAQYWRPGTGASG